MSAMAPLLLTVGGGALQAFGAHQAGVETARAAEFEKQQLDIQAQQQRTAADQSEARRREELTSNLETIQAIRAGRGIGAASPTGDAIITSAIDNQERGINIERANYLQKADLSRRAADLAERKARTSLLAGDLTAGAGLLSTAGRASSLYLYPSSRSYV